MMQCKRLMSRWKGRSRLSVVPTWHNAKARHTHTVRWEAAGLRGLTGMVEAREAQSKLIVENVEREWVTINKRVD
jgi:hypothetical protein